MYRVIVVIGLAASAALLALGCGGGGEESSATPLTKAQFIKQADRICAKFTKKRNEAAASFLKDLPGGPAEAEAHFDQGLKQIVAPSMDTEAKELAALVAPEDDAAKVSRMIGNLSKASSVIAEKGSRGVRRSGLSSFESEASAYGLKICPNPY
jgi:hypothetical protein